MPERKNGSDRNGSKKSKPRKGAGEVGSTKGRGKKAASKPQSRARAASLGTAAAADSSFAQLLRSRSREKIMPEAVNRLEGGRRLYAERAEQAAKAEFEMLEQERKMLAERKDVSGREARLARLESRVAGVGADAAGLAYLRGEMERGLRPAKEEWTVVGRVLARDGSPAAGTEVIFVDEEGHQIKELDGVEVGKDGMIRETFPRDVVAKLQEKGVKVSAAVRKGRRIVTTDEVRVPVKGARVHQFDLRINIAD